MMGTCIMKNPVGMGPMSCSALEAKNQCLAEAVNSALTSSKIDCLAGISFVCASKLAHYILRLHSKRNMVNVSAEFGGR